LRGRQSLAHVGMLGNIYFLPLPAHTTILLVTAVAALIVIGLALLRVATRVARRRSEELRRSESVAAKIAKLTNVIAGFTAGAFACLFTYLPGGPLFNSTILRLAFTALSGIIVAVTLIAGLSAIRLLRDAAVPTLWKIQAIVPVTSAGVLTVVMLGFWVPISWRSSDRGIDRVAKQVHDAGIFVQSTLVVYETFTTAGRTALINDPVVDFLMPAIREAWRKEPKRGIPLNRLTAFNQKVVGALHRNGVPIMAGTDAMGMELVAPGSSLHRELQLLLASGLSPYEVMRSATVAPAAFLGKSREFGTIAVGQRADLLLVSGNPLENVAVLKRPIGVMVQGRWLPRQRLEELLQLLARNE